MAGKIRYATVGAVFVAVVAVAGLVWAFTTRAPSQEKKLPDGTVLRVAKISFGERDPNYLPLGLLDRIKMKLVRTLPPAWSRSLFKRSTPPSLGGSMSSGPVHTNFDSLHIWITRRDVTNGITSDGIGWGVIVDDQGCEFPASQSGQNFGPYIVSVISPFSVRKLGVICDWLTFEAFPRPQKKFRLELFSDNGEHLADFVVENPAPAAKPACWIRRPVPMTNLYGDVAFTLADARIRPISGLSERLARMLPSVGIPNYQAPYAIAPRFEIRESGELSPEWQAVDMELWDSSGNCAAKSPGADSLFLSPRQDAWKLVVKFYGSEFAPSASNAVMKLAGVKVPKRGEFVALDQEWNLAGVVVHPVALAGPGRVVYANGGVLGASVLNTSFFGDYDPIDFTNINGAPVVTLASMMPQLAIRAGTLGADQRLTIRAVDGQGRDYYAESMAYGAPPRWPQTNDVHYLTMGPTLSPNLTLSTLNLPSDATNVDLYFCVHNARTEEFIFKPPTNQ